MADAPQRQGSLAGLITAVAAFIAAVGTLAGVLAANHIWPFPSAATATSISGPVVEVSQQGGSFGSVQVGHASSARVVTITITNSGKGSTTVHASLRGRDSADFIVALDTCADAPLPGNGSCQVQLNFRPKSDGEKVAKLTFDASNAQVPPPIALNGTGLPPGAVSFNPASVAFGLFGLEGSKAPPTSGTRGLKILNTGNGPVTISSVLTDDQVHFSVTADCNGKSLAPGQSCQLTVTFSTTQMGTIKGNALVRDDAPGSPHSVPLSGLRAVLLHLQLP